MIEIVTSFMSRILCIKAVNVSEYTIAIKKMKNRVVHEFEMNCLKVFIQICTLCSINKDAILNNEQQQTFPFSNAYEHE